MHRKKFEKNGGMRMLNSNKFNKYIASLYNLKRGGSLPRYKIAKNNMHMEYVHWDDPNKLVDRLRLLEAERSAGNPSHNN